MICDAGKDSLYGTNVSLRCIEGGLSYVHDSTPSLPHVIAGAQDGF